VVPVQQQDVPIVGEWIGTLDGLVNADVRAQVTGSKAVSGTVTRALWLPGPNQTNSIGR
jgi:hypothetical protein